jgi:hypothetical protein
MRQPEVRAGQLTNPQRFIRALLIAAMGTTGCYQYVPLSLSAITPNEEVRVRVTEGAAARLFKDLGPQTKEIDGRFAPKGPDSVSIAVTIDRAYRGFTVGTTTETLLVGRSEILEVRKREFSRGRTVLLSAGVVVGFGLLAAAVVQLADPNPDSDNTHPPPPPASRIPSGHFGVRIPIP